MTVVTCLATLTVSRAKDENGNPKIPVVDVTSGLLSSVIHEYSIMSLSYEHYSHPKPFDYVITPRSHKAEEMIATSLATAA
jgi:hypothetical protein